MAEPDKKYHVIGTFAIVDDAEVTDTVELDDLIKCMFY